MMKRKLLLLIYALFVFIKGIGQSTVITPGTSQPNITATSTLNGVVFPRMTIAQKNAIISISRGTVVYDTDLNCLSVYNGIEWLCMNAANASTNLPTFQDFQLTMNPSGNAPLAGKIAIKSNQPIKISYTIHGQDGEDFTFATDKFSADTTINLYALYANYNNTITVSIANQASISNTRTFNIQTDPLPPVLPQSNEIIVNAHNPGILSKFILCFPNRTRGLGSAPGSLVYPVIMDSFGKIRGYITVEGATFIMPLANGHWLFPAKNDFKEVDLMGTIFRTIALPSIYTFHHDVIQLPNSNLVYLGDSQLNNTVEDKVYTMDFNTGVVIDSLNLYTILDPTRQQLPALSNNDWFHANSLTYDATDNALIISGRHQSAVVKIDWTTKQLKWIFADSYGWNNTLSNFLLTPSGSSFEQHWGQHSAILNPNNNRTMLLFDNGNSRSYTNPVIPTNNYSRLVEYTFDENNKTVTQNFQFGKEYGSALYTPYISKVEYITNDRLFVGYGGILKDINGNAVELNPNARNQIRLFEVDRNQQVYYDISIKNPNDSDPLLNGFASYRAYPFNFR